MRPSNNLPLIPEQFEYWIDVQQGQFLALVSQPSSNCITIKITYGEDVLLALHLMYGVT